MKFSVMKCVPCEGGVRPMSVAEAKRNLRKVKGWTLKGNKIYRSFEFPDFKRAMGFAVAVGKIAEREGHHPDINIYSWNKVGLTLYTHAIGGLSMNDFIVAAKANLIYK